MQFLSWEFLAALAGVFLLYWSFPRRPWQNLLLLGTSLGLILYLDPAALAILAGSTFLEWLIALRLGSTASQVGRFRLLLLSVALNAAQLAFFKYSQFFLPQMTGLLHHLGFRTGMLRILMPVGLSFWTLQKMTLTLDVFYRRRPAERNFLNCLLFTSFFPTLLSGPIEYSRNLLPQFEKTRKWDAHRFSEGVWLFAMGAFLKAVVADNVASCAEDLLSPGNSGISILLGIWAYALQIFGDFAGYSYMARGCARFLGIDVTQNFLAPYLSRNLSDYWKHWHISLSTWLNDFIFVPTSMTFRGWGTASIVFAIWVTFLVSGLWHGTGLNFVVWGCIHALGLTLFSLTRRLRKRFKDHSGRDGWLKWVAVILTFNWACLGYIFFRSPNLPKAMQQLGSLFHNFWSPIAPSLNWGTLVLSALGVFWLQLRILRTRNVFWIFEEAVWYRVIFYLVLGFLLLRYYAPSDRFIYFQF